MASAGKSKKVLMLLENNPYPQDGRVRREAEALLEVGHQVSVIAPRGKAQPWTDAVNGVRVFRYPAPPEADGLLGYLIEYGYSLIAAFILSIVVWIRVGFDVIHAHNPPDTFVFVAMWFKLVGKRFIFDHHDLSPEMYFERFRGEGNPTIHKLLLWIEKVTFKFSDHVIATNESYKAIAIERGGLPENRVSIVRNGPDLNRLKIVDPDPELRKKAGTIIAYVGVMGYQDGIDYFLRAAHHLIHDLNQTDFYCVMIGRGDAYKYLQQVTKDLDLESHVWFPGYVTDEELVSYLNTADLGVDPDPSNPFNDRCTMIKMTEYMALGKPIVAFDLPEHRVTAGEAAIYATPNEELDFAKKIAWLMDHPEERERMGKIGRERIETSLSWDHQKPILVKAYETVFSHSRRGLFS